MNWLDRLLGRAAVPASKPQADASDFVYIMLPEEIDPLDRAPRYGDAIDRVLGQRGLGGISGGGSMMTDGEDGEEPRVLFSGIDVDTPDGAAARAVLRELLPMLGCPTGTRLQFVEAGRPLEDRFDDSGWAIARSRDEPIPGFDG